MSNEAQIFDLFWLRQEDLYHLVDGTQHTDLDDQNITSTEIPIFQKSFALYMNVKHIDKEWAQTALLDMQQRLIFSLTPEFLGVCFRLNIDIPFAQLNQNTYSDNIARRLKEALENVSKE